MDVAIIGTGYVGLVTGACFADKGHRVLCVDNDARKVETLRQGKIPIYEPGLEELVAKNTAAGRLRFGGSIAEAVRDAKVIFIAVGTPPLPDGSPDLSYLEAVSREIAEHLTEYRVVAEKSTVPVQTGDRVKQAIARYVRKDVPFDVASTPEFLREGTAVHDTLNPDRLVIGVESKRAEETLRQVYAPFQAPLIVTDIKSAELIKHASNSFLAAKISFINAVAAICDASGANIDDVARGMGMDARIGPQFLRAGIGYGGSCFPKDVDAFASIAEALGHPFGLLREVQRINRDARDRFVKKIEKELWVVKDKTIVVAGLAFKPDTDDVRESAGLAIAGALAEKGARVRACDPKGIPNARKILPKLDYRDDVYDAAKGADCLAVTTEWPEYKALDLGRLKAAMAHPTIVDGRNVYEPASVRKAGFTYLSMGRP